ncbi:unnamed protein product, partial [marine sediment metagenome]
KMGMKIAVTGKGGVGKTTLAAGLASEFSRPLLTKEEGRFLKRGNRLERLRRKI